MEKTIWIDGKHVRFKSTGATPIRYEMEFNRNYFQDIGSLAGISPEKGKEADPKILQEVDLKLFYRIAWVFAKGADPSIPKLVDWLDQFEDFALEDIATELQDLLMSSLRSKKKQMTPQPKGKKRRRPQRT
jgi:hypothetical protein